MIDLHCHILDGMNCGPESFDESIEICHQALESGVRTIVATPRWEAQPKGPPLPFAECRRKLDHLQHTVRGALSLRLGFMLRFSPHLPALVEQYGSRLTLGGGRYVLVSLPALSTPTETEEVWEGLARRGCSVVVAHPECSLAIRRDPSRLERWVIANGIMLQIDAASIIGAYGRDVQRFAVLCVRKYKGRVVVASNVHNASSYRKSFGGAREELVKTFGRGYAQALTSETPARIIGDMEPRLGEKVWSPNTNSRGGYFKTLGEQP